MNKIGQNSLETEVLNINKRILKRNKEMGKITLIIKEMIEELKQGFLHNNHIIKIENNNNNYN